MSFNKSFQHCLMFAFLITIVSCKENTPKASSTMDRTIPATTEEVRVFNFDSPIQLREYRNLDLDRIHPDLINPEISGSNYAEVRKSWSDFHQSLGSFLMDKNFEWGTEDEAVNIVHKIYFAPDGTITNYFFNILNDDINDQIKLKFAFMIKEFASEHKIGLQRNKKFAQCGKTKLMNQKGAGTSSTT